MTQSSSEIVHPDYIEAKVRREMVRVPFENITHFQSEDKYVVAYHLGGQFVLRTSLSQIEKVYGVRLVRVHRSALVVRQRLASVAYYPTGCGDNRQTRAAVDGSAEAVDVSRRYLGAAREVVKTRTLHSTKKEAIH